MKKITSQLSRLVPFIKTKERFFSTIALLNYIIYIGIFALGVFLLPNSILISMTENTSAMFNILANILLFGITYMRITSKICLALALSFLIIGVKFKEPSLNKLSLLYFIPFVSQVALFKIFIV